jgi:hypothetical protein
MRQTIAGPQRQDTHRAIRQPFGTQQSRHGPHRSISADSNRSACRIESRQTPANSIVIDKERGLHICIIQRWRLEQTLHTRYDVATTGTLIDEEKE